SREVPSRRRRVRHPGAVGAAPVVRRGGARAPADLAGAAAAALDVGPDPPGPRAHRVPVEGVAAGAGPPDHRVCRVGGRAAPVALRRGPAAGGSGTGSDHASTPSRRRLVTARLWTTVTNARPVASTPGAPVDNCHERASGVSGTRV